MPNKSDAILRAKLADLHEISGRVPDALDTSVLAMALKDKTNLVVARAAEIIGEAQLVVLAADLLAAYARLVVDGLRRDPTCAAKIAIVEALQAMGFFDTSFWVTGLSYRQMEPSYGPPIDTGARIRALSALSLARSGHPDTLIELTPLLEDPAIDARLGAIQAIAMSGQPGSTALLWHKLLVGDSEPEIYYEAFAGLLILIPERALPFVATFLKHGRPGAPESAALALGETRRIEALPYLQEGLDSADDPAARRSIILGMALLRQDEAMDFLISLIAEGPGMDADSAMKALEIVRHDEQLWSRAEAAYAARGRR